MSANDYYEWSKHYDPNLLELKFLTNKGINFSGKKVLEIGCGTGRFTERIFPYASEIMGIDPNESAVEICKQHLNKPSVKIYTGTLETVVIPKCYFDYAVFSWSMYMIDEKERNVRLAYESLQPGGKLIVLQANSGEYEEEVSNLYRHYASLEAYKNTYKVLSSLISKVFGNVETGTLNTYFIFDDADQVIQKSLFFVEEEEGIPPTKQSIKLFRKNLRKYYTDEGQIMMTDVVSVFIAAKKNVKYEEK